MQRINQTVLSGAERRVLDWLCRRMPAGVTSDALTALGVVGAGLCCLGYALSGSSRAWLWLAVLGMALNWLGDSLDGSLARFRNRQRPKYGFFLDHMTDTLAMGLVVMGIGLSPYVSLATALAALAAYYAMTILTMATCLATGVFRISFGGLGPTEIRLIIAGCTVAAIALPIPFYTVAGLSLSVYDLIMAAVTVLLVVAGIVTTALTARDLAQIDPLPDGD